MTTTRATVDDIATRFWEGFLESQPIYASMLGDRRYDDRLNDPGPAGRARDHALVTDALGAIADVDREALSVEDGITLGMLETIATVHLEQDAQRLYEFGSVDHLDGPQGLPGDLARLMAVDSDEAFDHLRARLAAYPAYVDAYIGNIDDGLTSGRTAAPIVFKRAIEQLERMVATPTEESPLLAALGPRLTDAQREALTASVRADVEPSIARYLDVVRAAAPQARGGDGALVVGRWRGGLRHRHPGLDHVAADGDRAPRVRPRAARGHRSRSAGHRARPWPPPMSPRCARSSSRTRRTT